MSEVKPSYLSKTAWINLLAAVSALFIPSVGEWISGHGVEVASILAGVNIVLRFISKDKITLW